MERRVRATLLLVGLTLAALGVVHQQGAGIATTTLGVLMVVGGAAPGGGLWWRLALPSIAAFGVVVITFVTDVSSRQEPAWKMQAVVLPIALAMSLEAMRVDAVRRLPPGAGSRVGKRERIELLRVPAWQDGLSLTFTCATSVLVFGLIALEVV